MHINLFDFHRKDFFPLALTRPVSLIRTGAFSFSERWERVYGCKVGYICESPIQSVYAPNSNADLYVNAAMVANPQFVEQVQSLQIGEGLGEAIRPLAFKASKGLDIHQIGEELSNIKWHEDAATIVLDKLTDVLKYNKDIILADVEWLASQTESPEVQSNNTIIGDGRNKLIIEKSAKVEGVYLNLQTGPIYIGKNVTIMEGSMLRGPLAICDSTQVKMGAKIYGGTTIGPNSRVGGEISNSVINGFSNKSHDGFLGDSILGEWCNLGADTNTSNLKNTYGNIKLHDYDSSGLVQSELQFCGLLMGDHSKCSINTMFNTGTTVGAFCNIVAEGFPDKFYPSYTWEDPNGKNRHDYEKAIATARAVMSRRDIELSEKYLVILADLFRQSGDSSC